MIKDNNSPIKKSIISFIHLDQIITRLSEFKSETLIIIIDLNVYALYIDKMKPLFDNKKIVLWKASPGESTKTFKEFESCLEFLLSQGVHRNCHLVAFGGGALSDFAGFIATTLLRGLSWSIIPTSLLSMIDASIGGKVAINSTHGKNLIGAFHHPENIYIDESFLTTLPNEEYQSGLGELIKYAFLDKNIKNLILKKSPFKDALLSCAQFKQEVTIRDFKESGERKTLNLGHTIGHALESIYSLKHGIAVFWGMVFIFILFDKKDDLDLLQQFKKSLDLKQSSPPWLHKKIPIEEIMNFINKDKKMTSQDSLEIILPTSNNKAEIKEIKLHDLQKKMISKEKEVKEFVIN